jgi:hypothetical protein
MTGENTSRMAVPTVARDSGEMPPDQHARVSTASSRPGSAEFQVDGKDFTLSPRGVLVFITIAILVLMVALDGTSISVALPV